MQVVVCAMAKNESLYIKDWVNYYLNLGFDKIFIYDNDDLSVTNDTLIENILPKSDKIEIFDIRGQAKECLQQDIYTNFYNTHKFDWCLFVDIDEYLVGIKNIKTYLSQYHLRNAKQIRIKWRLFGDDNLITRDMSKPVYKVFKNVINVTLNRDLIHKGNLESQGKMLVRGGLPNVVIRSPHFASFFKRDNVIPSILPSGRHCWSKVVINESYRYETIFINHYMTKSLSEFIAQKLNRNDAVYNQKLKLDYYWRINKVTPEKIAYLRERKLWDKE